MMTSTPSTRPDPIAPLFVDSIISFSVHLDSKPPE
jgi:hypothetical protein